jgi:hypothetical protein
MDGYDVVTMDDEKVGSVAGQSGDFLIVEHGLVLKSKRAVPRELTRVDNDAQEVRITVGKETFLDSPELDGELDEPAVLEHYGIAPAEAPATEGFGETEPGDPARSSEEQALRDGVEPAEQQRARIRTEEPELEESPGLLGDRMAGVEEQRRKEG